MSPHHTIITVGPEPERFDGKGMFFDGHGPVERPVRLRIDEEAQALVLLDGDEVDRWPLDQVRRVPDQAGGDFLVLRLKSDPVKRLMTRELGLVVRFPHLNRRAVTVSRWRLARWAGAAVASVALIIFVLVPVMADQLARFIPPGGERALGDATLNQIRQALDETGLGEVPFCDEADGMAALKKMQDRLAVELPEGQELSVHVLNHSMVNAFALPGGYVVFFRGLIEAAETPEEIAAVFAHEIGHVVSRDPTRHALRSAGSIGVLGLLFGDFAGGAMVLFLTEQLIQASYSREAEAAADAFAHDVLRNADLPPGALGSMFERLRNMGGDPDGIVAHFLSHPRLADRIEAATEANADFELANPSLTGNEWRALQNICD